MLHEDEKLLVKLRNALKELEELYQEAGDDWHGPEGIYRYYHGSYKVYYLQNLTTKIVEKLKEFKPFPELGLSPLFEEIIKDGTGKRFSHEDNNAWGRAIRPIVEAYMHAFWFLEQCIRCAKELDSAPQLLPYNWAAILELYQTR